MAIDMEGKYKARRLARDQADERDRIDAEEGKQMRANRTRANTMPVGGVKKKADPYAPYADELKMGAENSRRMFGKNPDDANKGKKKKDPIVSKAELDKSGFTNLRDFMNAKKYDEATGKFVDRAKALTRRDGKRPDVKASPAIQKQINAAEDREDMNKGGKVKSKSKSSASKRADGCAIKGKTRGKMV
jgi:hypothetical protein